MCNLYISEFYIWDLRSGQSRGLYISSLRENIEVRPTLSKRVKATQSSRIMTDYLICDDPGVIYWQGHRTRSSEAMWGHQLFIDNKSRYDGEKTCKWYQTAARLVKTRRLACNMTITPAPIGSWPDLDLRSSLNWPMEVITYLFRIVSTKHNGANPISLSFFV